MSEQITSTQNDRVKLAYGLQHKARIRRKERKLVLEGTRLIGDALAQNYRPLFTFYEPQSADFELIAQLQATNTPLFEVTPDILSHISDTQSPQGIAAVFSIPQPPMPKQLKRILILDAIREPGNMGTILRTAAAAAVQLVILAPECVDPYNPKVLRAGMGAHFRVPVIEADWAQIRRFTEDTPRYVAAGSGEHLYSDVDWRAAWALVIGNEAHGIGQQATTLDAAAIRIPMASETESLNAAVATGVILFEAQRQKLLQK